jgi:hypothetical protein
MHRIMVLYMLVIISVLLRVLLCGVVQLVPACTAYISYILRVLYALPCHPSYHSHFTALMQGAT